MKKNFCFFEANSLFSILFVLVFVYFSPRLIAQTQPPDPSGASVNPNPIACGGTVTLSATGVVGNVYWYSGSCGGTLIGTGSPFVSLLISNNTFYARNFDSGLFSNGCSSVTGTIIPTSPPTTVTAVPSIVSCTNSTDLNAVASGYSINWYVVPTGGTPIGTSSSGANFTILPTCTNTYYAEAFISGVMSQTFSYTGASQTFTVPIGISVLNLDVYGAQGRSNTGSGTLGGLGGRVSAAIPVTSGQVLQVNVGGSGTPSSIGGWNGGANGGSSSTSIGARGGGGGGASDIRQSPYSLSNVLIVAGGGGGAGGDRISGGSAGAGGGGGGGYFGGGGGGSYGGNGGGRGTQTTGGIGGTAGGTGNPGTAGSAGSGGSV